MVGNLPYSLQPREECDICQSSLPRDCDWCIENNCGGQIPIPARCVRCDCIGDNVDPEDIELVESYVSEREVFETEAIVQQRPGRYTLYIEADVPTVSGPIADVLKVGFEEGEKVKLIIKRVY